MSALVPGSFFPGTVHPEQDKPEHEVLISFDDASVLTPTWHYVTSFMRGYTINRGRGNELSRVDAGTETITLDNRDRRFDPTYADGPYYPNVTPMNRVWHRVRYAGETVDVFKGYVESWPQAWPNKVADAVATVTAVDEFKVLALDHLPTTDPPRDTYADLVAFDNPSGYWRLGDDPATRQSTAATGPTLTCAGTDVAFVSSADGAIVGEVLDGPYASLSGPMSGAAAPRVAVEPDDGTVNLADLTSLTIEMWVKSAVGVGGLPAIFGPAIDGSFNPQFSLKANGSNLLEFKLWNDSAASGTVTAATVITDGIWHHIVGVLSGGTMTLYMDAVILGTASLSGKIAAVPSSSFVSISPVSLRFVDEVAIYRYALTADRIMAHYAAGVARGFATGQASGARIGAILDAAGSHAPRDLQAGQRTVTGRYMAGQDPLSELRIAETAEAVDAVLFVSRGGEVTFLDAAHRSSAPYDAPVVTFADDDTVDALKYTDLQVDYSDSYLANDWSVTRTGGTIMQATDSASVDRYLSRPQSLTDLALTDDSDAQDVADEMLAKYKAPFLRVTSISPRTSDLEAFLPIMTRDVGDRIRVIRNPPGGGDPIDTEVFLQGIGITQSVSDPFPNVTWGVSPV